MFRISPTGLTVWGTEEKRENRRGILTFLVGSPQFTEVRTCESSAVLSRLQAPVAGEEVRTVEDGCPVPRPQRSSAVLRVPVAGEEVRTVEDGSPVPVLSGPQPSSGFPSKVRKLGRLRTG